MTDDAKGGRGTLHRAADRVEEFIDGGQLWVALAAGIGLLLLQIPGLDDRLAKLGLESSPELRTVVLLLLLTSILLELRHLKRSVTPSSAGRMQYPDPGEMYEALVEKAKAITEPEHREIEVLGLTLYSAWNQLSIFLERPEVNGWTVKLAVLSEDETFQRPWIPDSWPEESMTTVNRIREFRDSQGKEHHHMIELFEYEFAPAVHGFRLGNGDVFVSTLLWLPEGRLGKHRFSYDYVPARDFSPGGAATRKLSKTGLIARLAAHRMCLVEPRRLGLTRPPRGVVDSFMR